jgi:sugar/nucleoside kinase (ribokinase family)
MSLLVTGSIGIDTIEAPSGTAAEVLGGSSVYFAYAASFFTKVRLVGVVGEDCPEGFLQPLNDNTNIDMGGLEIRQGSKTFRWHGRYHDDVNDRDTINVELNVLGEAGPKIPADFQDSKYVFLANTHPGLQLELLAQCTAPTLVVADTMDLWIETERATLTELLGKIDGIVLNDSEAFLYTEKKNVIEAGLEIEKLTKRFVVIKKGAHGAILFTDGRAYPMPGYPTMKVVDPTGAGDSFAGGMMGYLAAEDKVDDVTLRRALAYGTVVASLELEDFSLSRMVQLNLEDIDHRLNEFLYTTRF